MRPFGSQRPRLGSSTTWDRVARLYDLQLRLERPALDRAVALAGVAADERLLDVATGTGGLLHRLADRPVRPTSVVGVDASSAMLARARPLPDGWELVKADARGLPFEDATFDEDAIRDNARGFAPGRFRREFASFVVHGSQNGHTCR